MLKINRPAGLFHAVYRRFIRRIIDFVRKLFQEVIVEKKILII
jgi:predicted secreted protein